MRSLLLPALALLLSGASYDIPGPTSGVNGADHPETGQRQIVRDSNGFWYAVWDSSTLPDMVILSYTTTTTPTAATDWGYVTLVRDNNTGVISATPANNGDGYYANLAMTRDDVLWVAWRMAPGEGFYSSTCTNLSALTQSASWTTPVKINVGLTVDVSPWDAPLSLVLDERNVPHAVFEYGLNYYDRYLAYTKYDTGTGAWLTPKSLGFVSAYVALTSDVENNLYLAYQNQNNSNIYLLASQDADTTDPANSTWKNLAQTTTDADLVSPVNGATLGGPDCVVDRNGILHVVWVDSGAKDPVAREGRIREGWQAADAILLATTAKKQVKLSATANGDVYGFFALASGGSADDVHQIRYTASSVFHQYGSWATATTNIETKSGNESELFLTQHKLWPEQDKVLWMVLDSDTPSMITSWTNSPTSAAGWRTPRPVKHVDHPHLTWVFPNASGTLGAQLAPVVAQTTKSAVYVADNRAAGRLYALSRVSGIPARSYTCAGVPVQAMGAAYGGNVHLFVQHNANGILKLVDDGTTLGYHTNWVNNPLVLATAGIDTMLPAVFSIQSGTRYVYALADGAAAGGGLFRVKADNGVIFDGPFGADTYQTNSLEPQIKFMNDQVFVAGNTVQLYRREADGSAEITSTALANLVLHLLQIRGADNNRLFVAPEDKAVWILNAGLKTTDWAGGQSANLGVQKTSGAYYTRYRNAVLVGAGNQLYRLNVSDGSIWANWPMVTPGNIVSLPVEWRTFVYFGMDTGRLYAVNSTTNVFRPNWPVVLDATVSTPKPSQIAFDALNGHVFFATGEGRIYKLVTE